MEPFPLESDWASEKMKTIKPLPEGVRHSMRSGIIMFDMARVVEELVFNSLDAGATKVKPKSNSILFWFWKLVCNSADWLKISVCRCLSSWVLLHALWRLSMMVSVVAPLWLSSPLCKWLSLNFDFFQDVAFPEMIWFCWEKDMVSAYLTFIIKDESCKLGLMDC